MVLVVLSCEKSPLRFAMTGLHLGESDFQGARWTYCCSYPANITSSNPSRWNWFSHPSLAVPTIEFAQPTIMEESARTARISHPPPCVRPRNCFSFPHKSKLCEPRINRWSTGRSRSFPFRQQPPSLFQPYLLHCSPLYCLLFSAKPPP